jgi:hypothetical protein
MMMIVMIWRYLPFRPVMLLWAAGLWWLSIPSLEASFHGLVTSAGGMPEDSQRSHSHRKTNKFLSLVYEKKILQNTYMHEWLQRFKKQFHVIRLRQKLEKT